MNIAIFTPNQNPYSETFIQAHKNFLKGKVFYYYGSKPIHLEGNDEIATKWQRRVNKFKKCFGSASKLRDKAILGSLKRNRIDVVLAEYGTHAHLILPLIKRANIPLVVHFHGYDASMPEVIDYCNNYKAVFQYASAVIAVSKTMEKMLLDLDCPREKLIYNVYGPHPEFLKVVPTLSKKQFLAIGRFTDKKAPYYTILAFKKAIENHPDARLILAGEGQLLETCKNLVKYLNLEETVQFLGVITPDQYRQFLSESLGFIQHSLTTDRGDMEGTPLSVLEASAAGLPVIATNHAGIPDVIIHGETGLLCEEHDVNAMALSMKRLLDHPEFAKSLGAAGKENVTANYTLERHIENLQRSLEASAKNFN